jgi:MFS family permease
MMDRSTIDFIQANTVPFLFVLGTVLLSGFLIRWVDRKKTPVIQFSGVSVGVLVMILGWNDTADPFKFWVWETVVGLILPLLLCCTYLFIKRGIPAENVLKYAAMPFGFLVSASLMFNASYEESKDAIITAMFPSIIGAFVSAVCLGKQNQLSARSEDVWDYVVFFAAILSASAIVLRLDQLLFRVGPIIMFIGATTCIFISLQDKQGKIERVLEASLYAALVVIALNTIIYMDEGTPLNTEERRAAWQAEIDFMKEESPEYAEILMNRTDEGNAFRWIPSLLAPIIFSIMLYCGAVLVALVRGSTDRILRLNWHLAEGFVFIVFIFFSPYSVLSD